MTREEALTEIKERVLVTEYVGSSYVDCVDIEALRIAIKALEEQSEQLWISVSEKLPEPYVDVIVTNGIGIYIGWINPTDKGWRVDSENEYFMKDIIAWMPRPEEYQKEGEE